MINVIARAIARLIDGWPLLIKRLWQIMYFSSQGKKRGGKKSVKVKQGPEESNQTSCNIDCAICDVCDFKGTITLSCFKTDTCSC